MKSREELNLLKRLYEEKVLASEVAIAELSEKVKKLTEELSWYKEKETYILGTMTDAQKNAETKINEAEQTAQEIKGEAQSIRDAADEYARVTSENVRVATENARNAAIESARAELREVQSDAAAFMQSIRDVRSQLNNVKASLGEESARVERLIGDISEESAIAGMLKKLISVADDFNMPELQAESASEVIQNIYRLSETDEEERVWTVDEIMSAESGLGEQPDDEDAPDIDQLIDNIMGEENN